MDYSDAVAVEEEKKKRPPNMVCSCNPFVRSLCVFLKPAGRFFRPLSTEDIKL